MINRQPDTPEQTRLRAVFESQARDTMLHFRRSRRGTYMNPSVARDWKWFLAGVAASKGLS